MVKRCVIYCRVSTDKQEDNASLPTQLAKCEAYAKEQGWEVVATFKEVFSGTSLHGRKELKRALTLIGSGGAEIFLAYSLDRMSRDQNHAGYILSEVERVGATVDFATEGFDDTPLGRVLRSMVTFAAELEAIKIKERTGRGKRDRAEGKGKLIPGNKPPYGLLWESQEKARLIPDPETVDTLVRMFTTVSNGGSATALAKELTAEGRPTPSGLMVPWRQTTIIKILRNPIYTGKAEAYRYARTKGRGKKRDGSVSNDVAKLALRPVEDRVPLADGVAPVLISPTLFATVEHRLGANKSLATRNALAPESFLLRGGFARCGYCGGSLSARTERRTGRDSERKYYQDSPANRTAHHCPGFTISALALDAAVEERLMMVLEDPAFFRQFIKSEMQETAIPVHVAEVERAIAERNKRIANLMANLELLEGPEAEKAIARIKELGKERDSFTAQLSDLQAAKSQDHGRKAEIDTLYQVLEARLKAAGDHEGAAGIRSMDASLLGDLVDPAELHAFGMPYAEKRKWLELLDFKVKVWATDHEPRWEITSTIDPSFWEVDPTGDGSNGLVVTTTSP